jgi:hypothetical protein
MPSPFNSAQRSAQPAVPIVRTVLVFMIVAFLVACAGPFQLRKSHWTVTEDETWYQSYRNSPGTWDGILYQGSSSERHHFIARVMDDWAIIKIRREDLTLAEERIYPVPSSAGLGYYFVDPGEHFRKLRDYP